MEKEQKGSEKKVMVVIDETEHSYHALIWVLDNLKELVTESSFIIFATQQLPNYVAPQLASAGLIYPFGPNQDLIKAIQQRTRIISEGLCEKAKSICASRGVFIKAITEAGEPKEVICNAVYKHGIDLLVMPDDHSCPLKRIFCGEFERLLLEKRQVSCPSCAKGSRAKPKALWGRVHHHH
ncbi:UspA [Sesbania bispinosa]|nr:UspA [Sesbania bispinosa]